MGNAVWGLLTSVNFAVLQIIVLSLFAVVGMTLRQLPGFAFRSPTDYANEMDRIHTLYDAALGTAVVDALERLQLWHVFSSTWFSLGLVVLIFSIVACTIDRTPRLWRQSAEIRVVQPDPFFDPKLPDRALMAGVAADDVASVLRRHRFVVRRAEANGAAYVYGDRNRWVKLATLISHLGLVLFLVAAAVTSRLGDEQGLVVAEGESLTVQPIGTPGLLLVRNLGFDAPGFLETGKASDFTTRLAVFQDGKQIAEKTIRVNDPLAVGGYTFHQNGFGPAPDVVIRDTGGRPLWSGPIPMTEQAAGFPFAEFAVPGRDVALQLLLRRQADGTGVLLVLPFRAVGINDDGSPQIAGLEPLALTRGESDTSAGSDFSVELRGFQDFTLLIAKRDPGQGLVWLAAGCLIVGLLITFWLPRRRIWARVSPDGRTALVVRADRYVDVAREFGGVLDDLVKARRATPLAGPGLDR
ncbi:MAG TPA: cytochrome c biogenesis protein ResB [Candidatus Limnocylindrales bacterium]|nr:cytochrome c biogenesis protein ResB [Candidatus Limnocylindrales bacterium]